MQVTPFKTQKVMRGDNLYQMLDTYLPSLKEKSIVVVTSKIVSICQGRVVKNDGRVSKDDLIKQEAQWYLDRKISRYKLFLVITHQTLNVSAGIDESNGNGYFILLPKNIDKTTEEIWSYLREKHRLSKLGVIISDSVTRPLRWGTIGIGLSWCGFVPLKNYIGQPDLFGREFEFQKANLVDSLAATAVTVMGEGVEQTPLVVITEVPFISFQSRPPTPHERQSIRIDVVDDIYAPLLTGVKWRKGGKSR